MCCKIFENRFTNKNLTSKNDFELGFCIGKGDNLNIFNFIDSDKFVNIIQTFGPLVIFFLQFGVGFMNF